MKTMNYIPNTQRNHPACFICIVCLVLFALPLNASDAQVLLGSRDGLELHLEMPDHDAIKNASSSLNFTITNTNNYKINYLDNGRGNMFSFTLLDHKDQRIEQIPQWYRRNDPYASDVGKRSHTPIAPGQQIEFTICLKDAYGDKWTDGKTLLIKWEPSDGNDGLFPNGWELKARCNPAELLKIVGVKKQIDAEKSNIPIDNSIGDGGVESNQNNAVGAAKEEPSSHSESGGRHQNKKHTLVSAVYVLVFLCIIAIFIYRKFFSRK